MVVRSRGNNQAGGICCWCQEPGAPGTYLQAVIPSLFTAQTLLAVIGVEIQKKRSACWLIWMMQINGHQADLLFEWLDPDNSGELDATELGHKVTKARLLHTPDSLRSFKSKTSS